MTDLKKRPQLWQRTSGELFSGNDLAFEEMLCHILHKLGLSQSIERRANGFLGTDTRFILQISVELFLKNDFTVSQIQDLVYNMSEDVEKHQSVARSPRWRPRMT